MQDNNESKSKVTGHNLPTPIRTGTDHLQANLDEQSRYIEECEIKIQKLEKKLAEALTIIESKDAIIAYRDRCLKSIKEACDKVNQLYDTDLNNSQDFSGNAPQSRDRNLNDSRDFSNNAPKTDMDDSFSIDDDTNKFSPGMFRK